MQKFIGVKIVEAEPMDEDVAADEGLCYTPASEAQPRAGYRVRYPDGYESWCPQDVFERANRPTNGLPFGHAIEAAKQGCKIARKGWNGKGMYVCLQEGSTIQQDQARGGAAIARAQEKPGPIEICPHLDMRAADGSIVVGWLASQTDMLSDDWMIIE